MRKLGHSLCQISWLSHQNRRIIGAGENGSQATSGRCPRPVNEFESVERQVSIRSEPKHGGRNSIQSDKQWRGRENHRGQTRNREIASEPISGTPRTDRREPRETWRRR
jgi:hypothetical protein